MLLSTPLYHLTSGSLKNCYSFWPLGFQSSVKKVDLGEGDPCEIKFPKFKSVPSVTCFLSFPSPLPIPSSPQLMVALLLHQRPALIFLTTLLEFNKPYCHFIHFLPMNFLSLKKHFPKRCSISWEPLCIFFSCFAATEWILPHIFNHSYL